MKRIISVFLCLILILSFSSCTESNNISLTMGVTEGITSFDPIIAQNSTEKLLYGNCFEGLLRFDNEGRLSLAGATGYTIGKNGLSYTFKLNPDAHFFVNNTIKATIENLGLKDFDTNITAQDYIFGLERFQSKNADVFSQIKEFSATDDYTLEITLKSADADLLYKLAAYPVFPCRKDFFERAGDIYGTMPALILTNGPYYV